MPTRMNMKAVMWSSVVLEIFIFLLHTRLDVALGEYFAQCDGIANESYIASTTNCSAYIYCNGQDSLMGFCDAGEYFVANEAACDYKENVYCPLDDVDEETETSTIASTDATAAGGENGEEEIKTESTTAIAMTTRTTTVTMSVTGTVQTVTTIDPLTMPPIIKNVCPTTDDPNQIVFIPNSQSCSDFYLCYHGNAIAMHCSNHLHFNTNTGRCDFPENAQCLIDRPNANKCLPSVTDFFPHPDKCNYFYYCVKGFMTIQQCPFYYGWDIERRTCVPISIAKCSTDNQNQFHL